MPPPLKVSGSIRLGGDCGFTLLELIISLTITTLVVLVIYSAFSMGVRVWERQGEGNEELRREEVMLRLLDWDIAQLSAYSTVWEARPVSFFAGGSRTLFYVTRHGFGALDRLDKALFFTCLFVDKGDNDSLGLFLYKVPVPGSDLLREVRGFLAMNTSMRGSFTPPEFIRDQAVLIADGFNILEFSYFAETFTPFAGQDPDAANQSMRSLDDDGQDEWIEDDMPGQIQVRYARQEGEEVSVALVIDLGAIRSLNND